MRNLLFGLLLFSSCTSHAQPAPSQLVSTRCDSYEYGIMESVRYGRTEFVLSDSAITVQGKTFLLRPGTIDTSDDLTTKRYSFDDKEGHTVTVLVYERRDGVSGIALMHGGQSRLYYITNLKTL